MFFPVEIHVLDGMTRSEKVLLMKERENHWIDHLLAERGGWDGVYNVTRARVVSVLSGETGLPIRQFLPEGGYVDWRTQTEAERETGVSTVSMAHCCHGRRHHKTAGGFTWKRISEVDPERVFNPDKIDRAMVQARENFRQFIPEGGYVDWRSLTDAERETGISKSCISQCVRGHTKSSGGFKWAGIDVVDLTRVFNPYITDKVLIRARENFRQFLPDGGYVDWCSLADAVRETGISTGAISACANGRCKTAGGFGWERRAEAVDPERVFNPDKIDRAVIQARGNFFRQLLPGGGYVDWASLGDVERETGISSTSVSNFFLSHGKSAGGFAWERITELDPERVFVAGKFDRSLIRAKRNFVRQFLAEGGYVDWASPSSAERETGIARKAILQCASGSRKTAGGFEWKLIPNLDPAHAFDPKKVDVALIRERRISARRRPSRWTFVRQFLPEGGYVDWRSLVEAERETGISSGAISLCVCGCTKSSGGFKWAGVATGEPERVFDPDKIDRTLIRAKQNFVRQFLPSGGYVDWQSQTVAAKEVGIGYRLIWQCCNGDLKTAGGFRWEWIAEIDPECVFNPDKIDRTLIRVAPKCVRQFLPEGGYVDWQSPADVESETNITRQSVLECIRGKIKTAGGFKWKRIPEVDPERVLGADKIARSVVQARRSHVRQFLPGGEYVDWLLSADVERVCGISHGALSRCLCGHAKTAGGFKFKRISEVDPERVFASDKPVRQDILARKTGEKVLVS